MYLIESEILARIFLVISVVLMLFYAFKPLSALGVYIVFRPLLQPAANFHYSLFSVNIGLIIPILLFIIALCDVLRPNKKIFTWQSFFLILLVVFSLPSLIFTVSIVDSFSLIIKLLVGISAFLIAYNNVRTEEDVNRFFKYFFLSAIIPVIFGFINYFEAPARTIADPNARGARISSFLMFANVYGEYLSILICVFTMRYLNPVLKRPSIAVHILFAAIVINFILALNRGTWLTLSFGFVAALFLYWGTVKLRWLVIASLAVIIIFGPIIISRFSELEQRDAYGQSMDTFSGRVNGWKHVLRLYTEHPLTGYGIGSSGVKTQIRLGVGYEPHSDYVRVLSEAGPLAFLCYFLFMFSNVTSHLNRRKLQKLRYVNYPFCALGILFAVLSSTQNIITVPTTFPLILACLGVSAATPNMVMDKAEKKSEKNPLVSRSSD